MKSLCVVLPLLLSGLYLDPAPAATYVIHPDGTGAFATIQDAVNAAADTDIIELTDGTFAEAGNRDVDFLGKAITIRSQSGDPDLCILDCDGSAGTPHRGFLFQNGEGLDSVLEGVTIRNGYAGKGGGMFCDNSVSPTVTNCVFRDNRAEFSGGGVYSEESGVVLTYCVFWNNTAGNGGGVDCDDASPPNRPSGGSARGLASIDHCTFVGNAAERGAGIDFEALGVTVSNSIIAFSTEGDGVSCFSGGNPTFTCCDIFGNAGGDDLCGIDGGDNIFEDPWFCDADTGNFTLHANSPCVPENAPECGLIGARPEGCGPTPNIWTTWGRLKTVFD